MDIKLNHKTNLTDGLTFKVDGKARLGLMLLNMLNPGPGMLDGVWMGKRIPQVFRYFVVITVFGQRNRIPIKESSEAITITQVYMHIIVLIVSYQVRHRHRHGGLY